VCNKVKIAVKGEKLVCILGVIELLSATLQEIVAIVEFHTGPFNKLPHPVLRIITLLRFPRSFFFLRYAFRAQLLEGARRKLTDNFDYCVVDDLAYFFCCLAQRFHNFVEHQTRG